MSQSKPATSNLNVLALLFHTLFALVPLVLLVMFVPVVMGESSGEGAGMGVFLLVYFLGIPLLLLAAAATVFSIRCARPELLPPTLLLWLGVVVAGLSENSLVIVLFSVAYMAAVLRAWVLHFRVRNPGDGQRLT